MKAGFVNIRYGLCRGRLVRVRYRFTPNGDVEYIRGCRRQPVISFDSFRNLYPFQTKRAAYAGLAKVLRGQVTRKRRELAKLEAEYDKARLFSKKMPGYRPERPWRR